MAGPFDENPISGDVAWEYDLLHSGALILFVHSDFSFPPTAPLRQRRLALIVRPPNHAYDMNRENLIQSLINQTPIAFVDHHLFDCIPELFANDRALFINWKRTLAEKIEVDPACITIVGSAATGASLNPSKNFKLFDTNSDIDVAIVSPYHFTVGWRYLRMNGARRLSVDARTRIAWDEHVKRYIYWGTIATDRLLGVLPFGLQWLQATSDIALQPPTIGRTVNLRIYADYDSLRAYHVQGIRTLRDSLIG